MAREDSHSGAAGRAPDGRPARQRAQRGAGRPLRGGQDHPGRGPARGHRRRSAGPARSTTAPRSATTTRPRCASSARSAWRCAPLVHDGVKINLLDTPGYADFVGELRAGLRAADAALFVISAAEGVDGADPAAVGGVRRGRHAARRRRSPSSTTPAPTSTRRSAQCQEAFGDGVLPALPAVLGDDGHASSGLIGLLSQRVYDYSAGDRAEREPDPEHLPRSRTPATSSSRAIIEESEDETLMDRYLGGEEIDVETLIEDLEKAVARGTFHPVLPVCAADRRRRSTSCSSCVDQRLPVAARARRCPRCPRVDGTPAAAADLRPGRAAGGRGGQDHLDPYVGRVSLVRVFSGTLRPDATVHVSGPRPGSDRGHDDHDEDERIGALSSPLGKQQRAGRRRASPATSARSPSSSRAETGDTLSDKDDAAADGAVGRCPSRCCRSRSWPQPRPTRTSSPRRWRGSSPRTRRCGWSTTRRPTSSCCGAWARRTPTWCSTGCAPVRRRASTPSRCGCRCARRSPGRRKGHGRHVKQSGGHGQYAVCDIEVEPLPAGAGFEFVDKVVGGAVPRQFIPSVEKGVRAQMERGRRRRATRWSTSGSPCSTARRTGRLLRRRVPDRRRARAARGRRRDAGHACSSRSTRSPSWSPTTYVGAVMSDLSGRRGRVLGTEPVGGGPHPGPGRGARRWSSPATRSTCARCRTARARSPAPSLATSRCRPTSETR